MHRYTIALVAVILVAFIGGCTDVSQYPQRSMGNVNYIQAVDTTRMVMAQYYTVAKVDADAGEVQSLPKRIEPGIMGGSTREIATVYLRKEGGEVVVYAHVQVQLSGSRDLGTASSGSKGTYSSVPNQTPAEVEAATTAEQNQDWVNERENTSMAYKLLNDIYDALHGKAIEPAADKDSTSEMKVVPKTDTVVE